MSGNGSSSTSRRRRVRQPAFRDAVRGCGRLGCEIAVRVGIRHFSKFSTLTNASSVPDTRENITTMERIADAIGFDRSQIFMDGGR